MPIFFELPGVTVPLGVDEILASIGSKSLIEILLTSAFPCLLEYVDIISCKHLTILPLKP